MMTGSEFEFPEPAIRARVQEWALDAPGTGLVWLNSALVAAGGDGRLHFVAAADDGLASAVVHDGAILTLAADRHANRVISGGDDGRIMAATSEGRDELLSQPGRWVEAVAVSKKGCIAAGIGREVLLLQGGERHASEVPSTAAGLAFDAKGATLAVAHYGGVSLYDPAHPKRAPQRLGWKGSHIRVSFSPNGKFVVSVMSENTLHGWRVKDGANMAMSGYPAKPRSLSWSADGRLLASSGADGAIIWSFAGRDGPMGTSAISRGDRGVQVTALAWHPSAPMLALGYRDGAVRLCRSEDDAMLPLRQPDGDAIGYFAFDQEGRYLAVLSGKGKLSRFDLSA
jgi:WD40 repeat protein